VWICSRDSEAEAMQAKVLTKDEARRIAVNVARLSGAAGQEGRRGLIFFALGAHAVRTSQSRSNQFGLTSAPITRSRFRDPGESGRMSSRARRWDGVGPPPYWRDLERRSRFRIDPASRCSPTWPLERIRRTAAVCYLQRDVFIERSALDWIPAMVARREHYQFPSRCRTIAGLSGFLIFSQCPDRPDW
jgi:hypothetical protein